MPGEEERGRAADGGAARGGVGESPGGLGGLAIATGFLVFGGHAG